MKKWVIFEFGNGSFKTGFSVTLRIGTDGVEGSTRITDGFLPPAPPSLTEITLEEWRQGFEEWINSFANRAIKVKPQVNTVGINFPDQTQTLINDVNSWLNSKDEKWNKIIIENLLIKLNQTDEIRIIIQTDNPNLRRLPWQVWDLFVDHFQKTEFAFSPSQQKVVGVTASPQKSEKVKILVVLGDPLEEGQNQAIDYQSDINAINKLDAEVEFLPQPNRQELIDKLWEKPWQIIFYSGHSSSEIDGSKGYLQLRENEIITIDDLKESLRESITKGLQLAIFNSCQGLGIAKQLEDLALPQVIVMREKVPDKVAQMFLQDFLNAFAGGDGERYLHDALREARKKLRDKLENKYPGISWLPVICQQYPDGKPLVFNDFCLQQLLFNSYQDELIAGEEGIKIFISYAYEDQQLRDEFTKQLAILKSQNLIKISSYKYIVTPRNCQLEIPHHFLQSRVILLLISPDFLASEFCRNQIKQAKQLWENKQALIIPIRLRPVDYKEEWFSRLKPLPSNNKPVTEWGNRDQAFLDITQGIRKAIEGISSNQY